ncbi:SNF2 family ATP-dependent chromatin remodeller Swr1 [Schizosaccharomyces osmophilus]|uniref:DNA helicase n=1 Tax=Schizosaccharomyces osmophilus TaxID=2545709 RepID=A0AAE9WBY0_9SCHI|nr:SNF2 family ATP-dependent chromatin remodeller Swr1 [Schizosaccharomyces osmophilus]WBW73395.1 SNF2 family ATP-dependent chromatin remodeller Swr1 [Schizosaccharomyces osmophilus]
MTYEESEKNVDGPGSFIKKEDSSNYKLRVHLREPELIVTHAGHVVEEPKYENLEDFLNSYVSLEDGDYDVSSAEEKIKDEVDLRRRIEEFRRKGYFSAEAPVELKKGPGSMRPPLSYRDNFLSHIHGLARYMHNERKVRASRARKVSGMILGHFKRLSGADERKAKEEEKRIRLLAKRTAWEIRKKWKVVEREVRRRRAERAEEVHRLAGKEQLANILKHSTDLLEARIERQTGPPAKQKKVKEKSSKNDLNYLRDTPDDQLSIEELKLKYSNPEIVGSLGQNVESDESDEDQLDSENELPEEVSDDEETRGQQTALPKFNESIEKNRTNTNRITRASARKLASQNEIKQELNGGHDDDLYHDKQNKGGSNNKSLRLKNHEEEFENESTLSSLYDNSVQSKKRSHEVEEEISRKRQPIENEVPKDSQINEISTITANKVEIPFLFRGFLREYQQFGLEWLTALHESNTNGILADEMGLGKTIQTIALLAHLACEKENWGPHLIIVPTSVMLNWEMEFKKFLPGFKILTYYGNPQERKEKRTGWYKPDTWHVCITSYQLVLQDHQPFRRKKWQYMILDEAHNIKNFRSQRWQSLLNFNAEHRLLLTGTPLQNNLVELWSLLYFLMPAGVTDANSGFANLKDFQDWFSKPMDRLIEEGSEMNEEAMTTVSKLHRVLRPYLLRRLKTEVEKQMPGKYEHVVYCQLSKRQRFLYDDFINRARTREILASGNFMSIINCLMQLRKVCNHPNLHEERPIVTSFAQRRSAIADMEIKEMLVRKRLLEDEPMRKLDLSTLRLVCTDSESFDAVTSREMGALCASDGYDKRCTLLEMEIDQQSSANYIKKAEFGFDFQNKKYKRELETMRHQKYLNEQKCTRKPIFGNNLIQMVRELPRNYRAIDYTLTAQSDSNYNLNTTSMLRDSILSVEERADSMKEILQNFACITPQAVVVDLPELFTGPVKYNVTPKMKQDNWPWHQAATRLAIAFPDRRLLQYDCGKLQVLDKLLRDLVSNGHRALIFTQMTKVLDILEQFLNIHGHRYLRLDGATKIEQRQILTERFNNDDKIPVFILSTRSGGLGINLTGADTVIFYDSDWNPQLDAQAQDRSHRIGQTRDVHIYRLISEYTVESNMLRRANQKRMLDKIVIQGGEFTTEWFKKADVLDLFDIDEKDLEEAEAEAETANKADDENWEDALAAAEDEEDVKAAQVARKESVLERNEFIDMPTPQVSSARESTSSPSSMTPVYDKEAEEEEEEQQSNFDDAGLENEEDLEQETVDDTLGHIDEYMIGFLEREGTSDEW